MPVTEIHHEKEGVLVSWGHTCGHLSNPIWYESPEQAERERPSRESSTCWSCRHPPTPRAGDTTGKD
jgi:hypothetical protein